MNLNNNWSRNIDTGKWSPAADVLKKKLSSPIDFIKSV